MVYYVGHDSGQGQLVRNDVSCVERAGSSRGVDSSRWCVVGAGRMNVKQQYRLGVSQRYAELAGGTQMTY